MNKSVILRGAIATLACLSLGACLGSSGGGGTGGGGAGGGGGGGSSFADNASRVQNLGPQTNRQSGTIDYVGQARVDTVDPGQSAPTGFLTADLALAANFDAGTISGTATNIAGEVNGNAVTLSGTLDSVNGSGPNTVVQTDIAVPAPGSGTITTGALLASMQGTLTDDATNQSSLTELGLIGSFTGANADGAFGTASALVGDENAVGFGLAGGGTFYLDRQ